MALTQAEIDLLVYDCSFRGKSFSSVKREYGHDVYRIVRDRCVADGRGAMELTGYQLPNGDIVVQV